MCASSQSSPAHYLMLFSVLNVVHAGRSFQLQGHKWFSPLKQSAGHCVIQGIFSRRCCINLFAVKLQKVKLMPDNVHLYLSA